MKNIKIVCGALMLALFGLVFHTIFSCKQDENADSNGSSYFDNKKLEMISTPSGELLIVINGQEADDPASTDKAFIDYSDTSDPPIPLMI